MGQQDRTVASGPDDLFVRSLHLKSVREEAREVDFICSTSAIDSYGEIVDQSWDLRRYATNPVVLWAHNSRDLPIGQARNVGVVDGALQATIYFSKANPEAETIWQLVLEKTLRSVSVGFLPNTIRVEKRDGEDVCVLCDNELYEISVTSIPANPEALAKMKARALQSALPVTTTTAPVGATDGGKPEASMDHEKAIAALNDTIAQRSAELVDVKSALDSERTKTAELTARLSATEARNASLEGVAKDLAERAAAAERRQMYGNLSDQEIADQEDAARREREAFRQTEAERRAGREGSVTVHVHLNRDGRVAGVEVARSAGALFDEAAQKVVASARFSPARRGDRAVAVKFPQTVDFQLED
jgi:HK97 family phage prohead protease